MPSKFNLTLEDSNIESTHSMSDVFFHLCVQVDHGCRPEEDRVGGLVRANQEIRILVPVQVHPRREGPPEGPHPPVDVRGVDDLGDVGDDAVGAAEVDVHGPPPVLPVVGRPHHQVLDAAAVGGAEAVQVDVAGAGHGQAEASLVAAVALQGLELLELVLQRGNRVL